MAERSIPDEIKAETSGNAYVVVISYFIMFLYISFGLGSFLVGISGILIIVFSLDLFASGAKPLSVFRNSMFFSALVFVMIL